jgi:hypothetical protein
VPLTSELLYATLDAKSQTRKVGRDKCSSNSSVPVLLLELARVMFVALADKGRVGWVQIRLKQTWRGSFVALRLSKGANR